MVGFAGTVPDDAHGVGPAPRWSMGDARGWHGRAAVQRGRRISNHRTPARAGLHLAAELAGRCDREPGALRPGGGERRYDRPLDAFGPGERAVARKPQGLAANPGLAACLCRAQPRRIGRCSATVREIIARPAMRWEHVLSQRDELAPI